MALLNNLDTAGYRLALPTGADEARYTAAVAAWQAVEAHIIPWAARPREMDFAAWLANVRQMRLDPGGGLVPSTLYIFESALPQPELLGFLDLRHTLNDRLLVNGGHIGYGLVPAARGRGLAPVMLKLGLEQAAALGIGSALLTCDKTNLPSAKTIQRCGGVLENEVAEDDGNIVQRYWVPTA